MTKIAGAEQEFMFSYILQVYMLHYEFVKYQRLKCFNGTKHNLSGYKAFDSRDRFPWMYDEAVRK